MSGREDWTTEDWEDFDMEMKLEAQEDADSDYDIEDPDEVDDRHHRSVDLVGRYGRG